MRRLLDMLAAHSYNACMKKSGVQSAESGRILESTIAGSWYPGNAAALRNTILGALARVPGASEETPPNVLVLPHAGYAYSLPTAAHGIKLIQNAPFTRVVLLAPSHRVWLRNEVVAPAAAGVSTPLGQVAIDRQAIETLAQTMPLACNDAVHAAEHSTQILYPLLQVALENFKLVPLIVGELNRATLERAAAALARLMDSQTLLVVSSDFTHYGVDFEYAPFGDDAMERVRQVDMGACDLIRKQDLDGFLEYVQRERTTICGRHPLALMLQLLPPRTRIERLHYATSSDDSGDQSRFVCYLSMAGWAEWPASSVEPTAAAYGDYLTADEKRALLQMARKSIRHVLDTRKPLPPDAFAPEATESLRRPSGCFVTLKLKPRDELRGCIGEIEARRPLYQAVTALAVQSAFADPRFYPLRADEYEAITIEISVLTPRRAVDSWREIEIGRHGMTLEKRGHAAVFLPQVAPEQGWTLEETLTHLAFKAGLGSDDWKSGASFTVFEAIVFGENEGVK